MSRTEIWFVDETAVLQELKVGQSCATPLALFCESGDVGFALSVAVLEGGAEKVCFHLVPSAATIGVIPEDSHLQRTQEQDIDPIILNFDKKY